MSDDAVRVIQILTIRSNMPPYFRPQPSLDRKFSILSIILILLIGAVCSAIVLFKTDKFR